jgi:hypothetical protein
LPIPQTLKDHMKVESPAIPLKKKAESMTKPDDIKTDPK